MPWTARSEKTYKLCLLDTNAISEIVKNKSLEGKHFIERFPPTDFVPCFSPYNLIEIRRNNEVYRSFIEFFSVYPSFLVKPSPIIFGDEILAYDDESKDVSVLLNAFTVLGQNDSYNFRKVVDNWLSTQEMKELESGWRDFEEETLNTWLSRKSFFTPKYNIPNSKDAEKYIDQAGLQTLIQMNRDWSRYKIENKEIPKINKFPSVKIQLYSLYYRLYDPHWKSSPGEVTDILLATAIPYVDVYITEKFQANILSKIKNKVKGLDKVDIKRIRDLR